MRKKTLVLASALIALAALAVWWRAATPPAHHAVPDAIHFDARMSDAARAVEQSDAFAERLEHIEADIPGYDDIVFLADDRTALVSAMDGRIWSYDRAARKADVLVDPPLMAAGMHESPTHPDEVYFCASRLWGESYPANERVGLYRLRVATRAIEPVVLDVPVAAAIGEKVWPLDDPAAPRLVRDTQGALGAQAAGSRPLAFCNDLEISADGQRIYFSEPFAYAGASMGGGTIPEVIAHRGNGYVWLHDLSSAQTRLVAQGIHFPDGILHESHPGQAREDSILISQTTGFRILRLYLDGPEAGRSEVVMDGMPGMCDGMDRDRQGRIWCGMYARRTGFIDWLHANPWLKHVLLRLPLNWIAQPNATGVMALSPDASRVLYSAWYDGPKVTHIASAIEGPDGSIYLAPFSRKHPGLTRMKNPLLDAGANP
jgi:sugar lactone lactonase YvrE